MSDDIDLSADFADDGEQDVAILPAIDELFGGLDFDLDSLVDSMLSVAFDPLTPAPDGDLIPSSEDLGSDDLLFAEDPSADDLPDHDFGFGHDGYDSQSLDSLDSGDSLDSVDSVDPADSLDSIDDIGPGV